jgi:hypothetical protein
VDPRTPLNRLTRDQRLQGADTRAGRVAVATFLERPRVSNHADNHIGRGGNAFFGNEEMQLARVRRPETGKQSLFHDGVLDEVDVAIEVEPEPFCAYSSHRHNRREVTFRATTNHVIGAPGRDISFTPSVRSVKGIA